MVKSLWLILTDVCKCFIANKEIHLLGCGPFPSFFHEIQLLRRQDYVSSPWAQRIKRNEKLAFSLFATEYSKAKGINILLSL